MRTSFKRIKLYLSSCLVISFAAFIYSSFCSFTAAAADLLSTSQDPLISSFVSVTQLAGYQETSALLDGSSTGLPAGNAYYLSMTGSDQNDGSESAGWKTLQYAMSKLKAGDTLYIMEGVYQQTANISVSGTESATITVAGIGRVVFDGTNLGSYDPIFDTQGNDYLRFENIEVNNARSLAHITTGSHHIEIENLVTHNTQFAVWMKDASFVTVRNAFVYQSRNGFRGEGVTHDVSFENIEVYYSAEDNLSDNGYLNGDGFIFESDTYNLTFSNIITAFNADAGMDIKGDNVLIENVISYSNTMGLKLWGVDVRVVNALIYASKDQISSSGLYTGAVGINVRSGFSKVYNSTVVDNQSRDVKAASGAGLYLENSIVARRDSIGQLKSAAGPITERNVLWYRLGASGPDFAIPAGSLWADPGFVDWLSGDFRLKSTSTAINKGLMSAGLPAYDLDFNDRVAQDVVDLGAYEYQPADQPPVLTVPQDPSIEEGSTLSFTLSASDPEGDVLAYAASNLPAGASLDAKTGLFSWTPGYNQSGEYSIVFAVSDGQLTTESLLNISVLNVNRLPVFQSLGDKSVAEGDLLIFSVYANDPDQEPVTMSAEGLPEGALFDTQTRVFSWTPTYEKGGSYSVLFRATDGYLTAETTILLSVSDVSLEPPVTETELKVISSTNTQDYSWVSGKVYEYGSDILAMYGERTVAYDLMMAEAGRYFISVSTAQITSKNIPYAGYQFNINVYVDDVLVGNYDLAAERAFVASAPIDLGLQSQGIHRVKLQWTNDEAAGKNYNSNLGLKELVLSKEIVLATPPPEETPSPTEKTLVSSYDTQDYTYASGAVYNYSDGSLVMYGNRTVSYELTIADAGDTFMTLSTAQKTSKEIPYPDYKFNINITVDGQLIGNFDFSALREFRASDYIYLGSLSTGVHTLSIQWTNDLNISSTLDANLGIKDILLHR